MLTCAIEIELGWLIRQHGLRYRKINIVVFEVLLTILLEYVLNLLGAQTAEMLEVWLSLTARLFLLILLRI